MSRSQRRAERRARRALEAEADRVAAEERRQLNAAGRPLGVEIGVHAGRVVAVQVADDGALRVQHERAGTWTVLVATPRRGLRPWVIGFRKPAGDTDWVRLRGRAARRGLGDVGALDDGYWAGDDPLGISFVLQLLALPYALPAGIVGRVQATRARTRLLRALAGTPGA